MNELTRDQVIFYRHGESEIGVLGLVCRGIRAKPAYVMVVAGQLLIVFPKMLGPSDFLFFLFNMYYSLFFC